MTRKSKQILVWTVCGMIVAVAAVMADDCTFQKKAGLGPCAVIATCAGNVATYDPSTGQWHCNAAKTVPPQIYKSCVGSGTNRTDCVGQLFVECYRDTSCEPYEVGDPPVVKCRGLTPSGDWTPAEAKMTDACKPLP